MKIQTGQQRRKTKIRKKLMQHGKVRLTVTRSNKNITGQVFSVDGSKVLVSASSLEKAVKDKLDSAIKKKDVALVVGKVLGERALAAGIKDVAFDRSGYKFHGRVQALAQGAREKGLSF